MAKDRAEFKTEAEMCEAFIKALPETWQAYPETGGYDILLARKDDGYQIGIEAKLKLNAKVIVQVAQTHNHYQIDYPGPDNRAVLIPDYSYNDMANVCMLLGIQVITMAHPEKKDGRYSRQTFYPELPTIRYGHHTQCGSEWFEFCPMERIELPDYIPDTGAGNPSPITLTPWKVKAIKIMVILEKKGFVTRQDFKDHSINMTTWTQRDWLTVKERGVYVGTDQIPDLRKQHPRNYEEIEADYDKWRKKGLV